MILINFNRQNQFNLYNLARNHFIANPNCLIELECFLTNHLVSLITTHLEEIKRDYNEASYLYPFWENYPPDDRGRQSIKDQYPWIEVGEHAIGSKLPRLLSQTFHIRDTGFPTGADQRFILTNNDISKATQGFTDSAWLFVDIKSVGPRDDQDHTVMSHNQVSGNGIWSNPNDGVRNTTLQAIGTRASHDFHASLPPIFILSDATVVPLVIIALKPVYQMLQTSILGVRNDGQPLQRIDIACIPNGLLLTQNPNYLGKHQGLLFPGKDDKSKDPRKLRARVSFTILKKIHFWRVQSIQLPFP
jgi:Restriction endonuclease BglI